MSWTDMGTERWGASALQINPNQTLIIGGVDADKLLKTTELISSSGSEEGNNFPTSKFTQFGYDENRDSLNTTELISSSGSKEGNKFPVRIAAHCSFPFNASNAIVTGGTHPRDNLYSSANTWFVDLTTTRVAPGPTMKTERVAHGCSKFQHGTKSFGIVSGGWSSGKWLDSTEMIELDQESPTWIEGMQAKSEIVDL